MLRLGSTTSVQNVVQSITCSNVIYSQKKHFFRSKGEENENPNLKPLSFQTNSTSDAVQRTLSEMKTKESNIQRAIRERDQKNIEDAHRFEQESKKIHIVRNKTETIILDKTTPVKERLIDNAMAAQAKLGGIAPNFVDDEDRIRREVEIANERRESMNAAANRLIDEKITNKFSFVNNSIGKMTGVSGYVKARKEHAAHVAKNNSANKMLPEMIIEFSSSHASHHMGQNRLTSPKFSKYFMPSWDPIIQQAADSIEVQQLLQDTKITPQQTETGFFARLKNAMKSTPAVAPTLADLDLIGDALDGTSVNLRKSICNPGQVSIIISYNSEATFNISRYVLLDMFNAYYNRLFKVEGYANTAVVKPFLLIPTSGVLQKILSKDKILSQMALRYPESSKYLKNIIMFFMNGEDEAFHRWKLSTHALNRFTSYIFIVDSVGKIRWSGNMSEMPTEEELQGFQQQIISLISEQSIDGKLEVPNNRRKKSSI